MYFVTIKQPGYALFSTTPSERAAVALTEDQQRVHLCERRGDRWVVAREWPVGELSHTDIMVRLGLVPEPAGIDELVRLAAGS